MLVGCPLGVPYLFNRRRAEELGKRWRKINKAHLKVLTTRNHFQSVPRTLLLSRCRHAELPFQPARVFCVATEEREIHSRWEERKHLILDYLINSCLLCQKIRPPTSRPLCPQSPNCLLKEQSLCRTLLGLLHRSNWGGEQKGKKSTETSEGEVGRTSSGRTGKEME